MKLSFNDDLTNSSTFDETEANHAFEEYANLRKLGRDNQYLLRDPKWIIAVRQAFARFEGACTVTG